MNSSIDLGNHNESNEKNAAHTDMNKSQNYDDSDEYFFNTDDTTMDVSPIPGERESRLFSDINDDVQPEESLRTPLLDVADRAPREDSEITSIENSAEGNVLESWHDCILPSGDERRIGVKGQIEEDITISAIFLKDYENSRPCSLPTAGSIDDITPLQLRVHHLRYSFVWQFLLYLFIACLFSVSFFDGEYKRESQDELHFILTLCSALVLTLDVAMRTILDNSFAARNSVRFCVNGTRLPGWKLSTIFTLCAVVLETYLKTYVFRNKSAVHVWTGFLKPVVFFYASSKARDALTALYYIARIVFKVLMIEIFLLLSFAAMACHLYFDFDSFRDLPSSFLSLFKLQTTAATPGLWISVYYEDPSSVVFFVSFLIICVFYVHSIVLSVVFQAYIQSMKMIRERASVDRQEALKLAYLALRSRIAVDESHGQCVDVSRIRKVLEIVRPHYNASKIDALVQIMDDNAIGFIEFGDFRIRMQRALQTSLRSARQDSRQSIFIASLSLFVAIANLVYVLVLSSAMEFLLLSKLIFPVGYMIVSLSLVEVVLRLRPCACLHELSTTRHSILDGLAIFASIVSLTGLIMHAVDSSKGLQWLLLGRAIDMIRIMRLSTIFRSIIKRGDEVLPAIVGPLALVLSSMHILTYFGMAMWGGAVKIGMHSDKIAPLYDLNNFNDYGSGLLTIFNIFMVNDWQAIAGVYLTAERFSSPYIVYPFFIGINLLGVNILLNVLTAFFVGAFVTKVESKNIGRRSDLRLSMSTRLDTGQYANHVNVSIPGFHVLERQGYDSVMSTITGDEGSLDIAKKACEVLETFGRLLAHDNLIGFLVCSDECKEYYGNQNFPSLIRGYIDEIDLHDIVSQMFLTLDEGSSMVDYKREFWSTENDRTLVLSASLCSKSPKLALIVASQV